MTRFNRPAPTLLAATLFTALPLIVATPSSAVSRTHSDGSVSIAQGGGPIEIDDAPAGTRLATGGGAIHVGHTVGSLHAATGGGDIRLDSVDGTVEAATGNGDITAAMRGSHDISLASGHGAIELRLAAGVQASFDIETSYTRGHAPTHIRSDFPLTVTEGSDFESRHGDSPRKYVTGRGRAGAGTAVIKIRTVNADIRIVKG